MTQQNDAVPELTFPRGLPGFEGLRRFALARWGADDSPYSRLVALDQPETAFLVAPPDEFFDDYDVELSDEDAALIELADPADALVLVVITVTDRPEEASANLLGPIVLNTRRRLGAQVVQVTREPEHSTRVPLVAGV